MPDTPAEDSPRETAPDAQSLREWENSLDAGTRRRGADYAGENSVRTLTISEDLLVGVADAGSGSAPYRTTLRRDPVSGLWSSSCDCPVGISCKHAVALALAVTSGSSREGKPAAAPNDLLRDACEALGRDLTRKEIFVLSAMISACDPAESGRPPRASVEQALHTLIGNDYAALARLTDELEPAATRPLTLLAATVAALNAEGKRVPEWLNAVVTRLGGGEELDRERHERLVRDWRSTLGGLRHAGVREPARKDKRDMRLRRVGSWRFGWEIREEADGPWRIPNPAEKTDFLRPTFEPETLFTAEGSRVLELFRRFTRSVSTGLSFDVRDLPQGGAFGDLLSQPPMLESASNEDGSALSRPQGKLSWRFGPSPGKPGHARPFLAGPDGDPLPAHPLGFGLFLSEEGVHEGPPPLGTYDGRGAPPDIPSAVFEDPSVRAALKASGAHPPESFDAAFVQVSPLVTVHTVPHGGYGDITLASAELAGEDEAGRVRTTLSEGRWRTVPLRGESPSTLADTARLESARRHFFSGPRHEGVAGSAVLTEESVESYADWLSGFPAGTRFDLPYELEALVRPADMARLAADILPEREDADWFDLKLVLRPEDAALTQAEIKLLLAHPGRWVRLEKKGWRRLETSSTPETEAALAALGLDASRATLGETHRFHAAQLAGRKSATLFDAVAAAELRSRAALIAARPMPELPLGLSATLRPYQLEGFHFLSHLSSNGLGGILADDMGLGKTLQTLTWLLWLKQSRPAESEPFRALVVAPKSVVGNWSEEAKKFTPELKVAVFGEHSADAVAKADLVITNYARLRLAPDGFLEESRTAVVLDEGQHIKTPTSKISQCVRGLRSRHRLILSGTPVENRLMDLWSLFAFAMPGLLGSNASFKRQYDEKRDSGAAGRLASRVKPFLLRRTKSQVAAELPERVEEDIVVELEPEQRKLYDAEMKKIRAMLLNAEAARDFDRSKFNILASLLRLRQICCDPGLVSERTDTNESAKLDALLELLDPLLAEGHKVLVFSQFTSLLEIVSRKMDKEKIPHLTLTGATENRAELVSRFQNPETEKVFLLSLKAAGTGLNLTAASYVILFDPWWNPAAEAQAIDRTHRIGQKNKVIAYRLIAKNTVEEKIRALQREKAALAGEILREESLAGVLDIDMLRGILAE